MQQPPQPYYQVPPVQQPPQPYYQAPPVQQPPQPYYQAPPVQQPPQPFYQAPPVQEAPQPFYQEPPVKETPQPFYQEPPAKEAPQQSVQEAPVMPPVFTPPQEAEPRFAPREKELPRTESFPPLRETSQEPAKPRIADRYQKPRATAAQPLRPRGALPIIASVLICILLLTMMAPLFALTTVQGTLTKETFVSMIRRVDLDEIPMDQLDQYSGWNGASLAEAICDELNSSVTSTVNSQAWTQFTPELLRKLMTETTFPAFIGEHLEGLLSAFLEGDDSYSISTRDVEDVLLDNLAFITEELNLVLEEDDIPKAAEQFVRAADLNDIPLPDLDGEVEDVLEIARFTVSQAALIPLLVALLVLVVLLFVANLKQPLYAMRDLGIVAVLSTILPLIAVVGCRLSVSRAAGTNALLYVGGTVVSCVLESSLILYICVFAAGVAALVAFGVIRSLRKKRAAR